VSRIRLSDDEAWAVIAQAHTGILTTLRGDGVPIALPVWFVALDRRIYVSGPAPTKKFARIRHDPRVSFLVETGTAWVELTAVHLTGRAHVVEDADARERVEAALHEKYRAFRIERSAMPERTRTNYEVEVTTIEIVPDDRILSWENARLFDGEDR
jgi:PPOX class probable F420-dependent enzyme